MVFFLGIQSLDIGPVLRHWDILIGFRPLSEELYLSILRCDKGLVAGPGGPGAECRGRAEAVQLRKCAATEQLYRRCLNSIF